ncbi:MAG TPA: phage holin family protein [Bacteroidales bacterium]|jgi:putative membrane protein|nr:phage holin family protein [Bacteroidales bacterium]
MRFFLKWIASAMAIAIIGWILPGVKVENFLTAIFVAGVIAFLNLVLKPILILLSIPITVLTLGLFVLVINAIIVIIASILVPGFIVNGFGWALLFGLLNSIIQYFLDKAS